VLSGKFPSPYELSLMPAPTGKAGMRRDFITRGVLQDDMESYSDE
jgi:hypothetical protein